MQRISSAAAALAVSLFHTGISRLQQLHASTSEVKAESYTKTRWLESEGPAECSQYLSTLKKRRQRGKQSEVKKQW